MRIMIIELFKTFFKIGIFTFGGGYGMISLVKDECVDKKKWVEDEEFVNLIAISESTPGPLAVNMATYIGYKKAKLIGAIVATIGVVLPSVIVIYVIANHLSKILEYEIVANAFSGIRIAVAIIIIRTGYSLIRNEVKASDKKVLVTALFFIYAVAFFLIELFRIKISSVIFILSAVLLAIILSLVRYKDGIY